MSNNSRHRKLNSENPASNKKLREKVGMPSGFIKKIIPPLKYDDELNIVYKREDIVKNNFVMVGASFSNDQSNIQNIQMTEESRRLVDITESNRALFQNPESTMIINTSRNLMENDPLAKSMKTNISLRRQTTQYNMERLTKEIMKEEEETPLEEELKFLHEFTVKENEIENEHQTMEYFYKIKVDEILACLFAFMGVGSGLIYHDLKTYGTNYTNNKELLNFAIILSLSIVSVSAFFFGKSNYSKIVNCSYNINIQIHQLHEAL
jgi:hypothetical protein